MASDTEGRYEFKGLLPGRYQLRAALSNYISVSPRELEFDIRSHGCMKLDLPLETNGEISGRIFDAHGNPVPNQTVELADENGNGLAENRTETDDQGFYRFTGVRPGNFFIGINISNPPDLKHPYVRTFLPNVHQRKSAAIVHLPKAGTLAGQDIYLSTFCEPRTMQGMVIWPDGKPAANATISLWYPDYPWRGDSEAGPDAQGRFSVKVLTKLRTILLVQASNAAGVWINAGQVELPTEGPLKPVVLILNHQPESSHRR